MARVGAAIALGLSVMACEYVLPPASSAPPSVPDVDVPQGPEAEFKTGRASLALSDGSGAELLRVEPGSGFDSANGAHAGWTDDAGWSLRLTVPPGGAGNGGAGNGGKASVKIRREADGVAWSARADDCQVAADQADNAGLRGTATCSGLRWVPERGGADQAPPFDAEFDAEITFEANPAI